MSAAAHTASLTRPATVEHLPALLDVLDASAAEAGLDDDLVFALHLAAEEACTNVIKHGYGEAPGPLTLAVEIGPRSVAVIITDEAPLFTPELAPPPPLSGSVEDRPIGGLGWHFIREMTDEVCHEALPGRGNRLTLIKQIPRSTSQDVMVTDSHDLSIRITPRDGAAVAQLAGSINTTSAGDLLDAFQGAIAKGHPRFVVDCHAVHYLSSSGLGVLLQVAKEVRPEGGDLRLAAVSPKALQVLDLSGFTTVFQLYPDVEAALASYTT